ncbi:MAG: large conductance mechanosensitive channel protein MscL [Clostridia bacterium]|nr:large conductance mechanosensitive channel protein MscL [Clostridia bacterium]
MKKFFSDFKAFALKGNVVDMAVGVIIGGAFGAIVTSLINDIIMPLLGLIIKFDFSKWFVPMGEIPEAYTNAVASGEVAYSADTLAEAGVSVFHYGKFISAIIYFILIALCIFIVIRALRKAEDKAKDLKKKEEEAPAEEKKPRLCPYCKQEVAEDATRCPHCTSELPKE